MRTRADLSSQGKINSDMKWKLGARLDYDAVYDINDFYNADVRNDQRFNAVLRENYLDYSAGNWDFRFGRQHVVWGEMVGFFFADVVSARDMREFLLPDYDQLRTPQWAARAEYFSDDYHAELLWIPVASYDNIGKPGAEFYPYYPVPAGFTSKYLQEVRPERNTDNMNYGFRLSTLKNGWDASAFFYRSTDVSATTYREIVLAPTPTVIFQSRHERISQFGGTLAKDFGDVVLKEKPSPKVEALTYSMQWMQTVWSPRTPSTGQPDWISRSRPRLDSMFRSFSANTSTTTRTLSLTSVKTVIASYSTPRFSTTGKHRQLSFQALIALTGYSVLG